ncbi:MAG: DUF655 domain-containing protein [Myxococcota bacterium]
MARRHTFLGALAALFVLGTPFLAGSASAANPKPPATAPAPAAVKDVNTATAADFETVKGIGEKTAAKIIAERTAKGPFKSLEDLADRVKGVGEKTVEHFKQAGWVAGGVAPAPAPH